MKTFLYIISIFLLLSCSDQKTEKLNIEIESIEIVNPKDSTRNNYLKLLSIKNYLKKNKKIDIVKNFNFLNQDTLFISPKRAYSKELKNRLNLYTGQLTLFPISYKREKGPFATFKIKDKKLGNLESYILNFSFKNNKVLNCEAIIAFCKLDSLGKKQVSLFKKIKPENQYSIEQNLKSKNWH